MQIQIISTTFIQKHMDISTQCIYIAKDLLLIHPYIPPRVSRQDRKAFWDDICTFCDSWVLRNPSCKIFITGDLNTRDIKFGSTHSENHSYLDPLLTTFEIISDRQVTTRETSSLDVTLGNLNAKILSQDGGSWTN